MVNNIYCRILYILTIFYLLILDIVIKSGFVKKSGQINMALNNHLKMLRKNENYTDDAKKDVEQYMKEVETEDDANRPIETKKIQYSKDA